MIKLGKTEKQWSRDHWAPLQRDMMVPDQQVYRVVWNNWFATPRTRNARTKRSKP